MFITKRYIPCIIWRVVNAEFRIDHSCKLVCCKTLLTFVKNFIFPRYFFDLCSRSRRGEENICMYYFKCKVSTILPFRKINFHFSAMKEKIAGRARVATSIVDNLIFFTFSRTCAARCSRSIAADTTSVCWFWFFGRQRSQKVQDFRISRPRHTAQTQMWNRQPGPCQ